MSNKPAGSGKGTSLSRRQILAASSGIAVGLAGCSGNESEGTSTNDATSTGETNDGTTNGTTSGSGKLVDASPTLTVTKLPNEINFNRYAQNIAFSNWQWDYLQSNFYTNETYNWLLEDFSYDPNSLEMTYKFKEDFYWQDGTQVTAEDYYNQQEIARLMDPAASDMEKHVLKDDFTMVSKRKESLNPILVNVEEGRLWTRRDQNREWLEKFQDASSDDKRKSVTSELIESKIGIDEFAKKGLSNSVWKLKDWNEQEYVFEKFEKHPHAEDVEFDELNFLVSKGGSTNQLLKNDKVDFGSGIFPPDLKGVAPEYLQTVINSRAIQSRTMVFNYKNKHVGRRGVRRAITAALNFPAMGKRHLDAKFVKKHQSGLPQNLENKWLGSDYVDSLIPYSMKADKSQAAKFMREEGYTKEGGKWKDEDGDTVKFTYTTQTASAFAAFGKEIQQQLNGFGFDMEMQTMDNVTWYKDFLNVDKWDVTTFGHGWESNEPLNFYNYDNHYKMRIGTGGQIEGWLDDGETNSQLNGRPIIATVPNSVGATTVNGSGKEVNLYDIINELKTVQSKDRTEEIVKTLAWYFNYDLPLIDTYPYTLSFWADTKNFKMPKKSESAYYQKFGGYYKMLRRGLIKGVHE
jgi:peptide/nickel transport system substrate-binding protein